VVVDATELGLDAVFYAILGLLVGVPLAGLLIAASASGLGRRRFGFGSIAMGIVVSVAALVVVVVLWRAIGGEVTGWDLLWVTGLTVAGVWSLRRLASRPQASTERTWRIRKAAAVSPSAPNRTDSYMSAREHPRSLRPPRPDG
jgi:hypothetical protein